VTRAAIAIVVLGVALSVAVGVAGGITVVGALILAAIIATGVLVIAIARKSETGLVGPATCAQCGGLISSNAKICKHCGAPTG
jgi:hypothetical protein